MSAIAGLLQIDGAPVAMRDLEMMTTAMASRGGDGIGHWVGASVGLAQCMLFTTPESESEVQPLANEDMSVVMVLDGRVDNTDELRHSLQSRGVRLRDRTDAELVLRAYESWGEESAGRIIGDFAFFVWDARARKLFGARDPAGTRHFYYHAEEGWFGFASEIKGLLALERIRPALNESRFFDYLVMDFDRDDEVGTLYQGISRLPAGHAMRIDEHGLRTWRYWDPSTLPELSFSSIDECGEAFLEHLRVAIKCRLRSNGPIGSALSGGLDSSSIVCLIRSEFRDELHSPLKTFSLIREDRERCPEWKAIEAVLAGGWLEPTIIQPSAAMERARRFADSVPGLNEPFALTHCLPELLLYEAAKEQGCRVILDGVAGDLLFYILDDSVGLRGRRLARIPAVLATCRRHGVERPIRQLLRRLFFDALPPRLHLAYRALRDGYSKPSGDARLLQPEMSLPFITSRRRQRAVAKRPQNERAWHARSFTSGLLSFPHEVFGQLALSMGIEPRSPFSDRRLIEFAVRMPFDAKAFSPWYKYPLRRATAGILPEAVRWRRDWMGHPGMEFRQALYAGMAQEAPEIWNPQFVEGKLGKWVASGKLRAAWQEYSRAGSFEAGFNLFSLAIGAQWVDARFGRQQ